MKEKTRVLIVDDSRIFRGIVEDCLKKETDIEIIGSVRNGVKALEFIEANRPDMVTLDVEMPEMDGLETLKAIQQINARVPDLSPIGVIMLSSFTRRGADITIAALEAGAFDFIAKPESASVEESIEALSRQIMVKIRSFKIKHLTGAFKSSAVQETLVKTPKVKQRKKPSKIKAILIGVSTGGPQALSKLLPLLCEKVELPIFIVQHMPPTFTASLAQNLNNKCSHTVIEAKEGEAVADGNVYVAPGGRHLLLRKQGNQLMTFINDQPPELGCRPSVNVLFRSAGAVYGGDVVAIILTGMGNDGTKGISSLKRSGAFIIAQDEASSVVWGMPGSAVASGNIDAVETLLDIPQAVAEIVAS